jgi:membrane-bound ClpP family serine protease
MRHFVTWIAVALMLIGAVMLVADVGVAGLGIAVITIGIAMVAIDAYRQRPGQHHA